MIPIAVKGVHVVEIHVEHKYVGQPALSHYVPDPVSISAQYVPKDVIYVTETPIAGVAKFAARMDVTITFVSVKLKNQDDAQSHLVDLDDLHI